MRPCQPGRSHHGWNDKALWGIDQTNKDHFIWSLLACRKNKDHARLRLRMLMKTMITLRTPCHSFYQHSFGYTVNSIYIKVRHIRCLFFWQTEANSNASHIHDFFCLSIVYTAPPLSIFTSRRKHPWLWIVFTRRWLGVKIFGKPVMLIISFRRNTPSPTEHWWYLSHRRNFNPIRWLLVVVMHQHMA